MTETPQTTPFGRPTPYVVPGQEYSPTDETAAWPVSPLLPPPPPTPPTTPSGYALPASAPTPPPSKGMGTNVKAIIAVGLAMLMLLGGVATAAAVVLWPHDDKQATTGAITDPPPVDPPAPVREPLTAKQIAERLRPSTVLVLVELASGGASGTGIVLPDGEIITNNHVINGAKRVSVVAYGDKKSRPAQILGSSTTPDIALLKVSNTAGLEPAELGSASSLEAGAKVFPYGYPKFGDVGPEPSITQGIVSAIRDLKGEGHVIQTDAAINHGNSGGPLADEFGVVVGINTFGLKDTEGMGFAIAIDEAKDRLEQLRSGSTGTGTGTGGTSVNPPAATCAGFLGVSVVDNTPVGARITTVTPGSPAAKIGFQPGDVIVSVDQRPATSSVAFANVMRTTRPGQVVVVLGYRNGTPRSGEITLATPPSGC